MTTCVKKSKRSCTGRRTVTEDFGEYFNMNYIYAVIAFHDWKKYLEFMRRLNDD